MGDGKRSFSNHYRNKHLCNFYVLSYNAPAPRCSDHRVDDAFVVVIGIQSKNGQESL